MVEDFVGLVLRDQDKVIHDGIASSIRQPVRDHAHKSGYQMVQAFATNDERMLAALKLIGYETIGISRVNGVERYAKLSSVTY